MPDVPITNHGMLHFRAWIARFALTRCAHLGTFDVCLFAAKEGPPRRPCLKESRASMEQTHLTKPQPPRKSVRRKPLFTVEKANRALPLVQRIVADIVKQHKKVCALEERCHMRRPNVSEEEQARLGRQYSIEIEKLRDFAEELAAVGCDLKDWRRGLIDFAANYQGREVELCWHLGEDRVAYWHEVGAGFPGRHPIDDIFAADVAACTPA